MRRDMDVIRNIVLAVRDATTPISSVEGISPESFAHHAQLLDEAGLAVAALAPKGNRTATQAVIFRLTWEGHDFADSVMDVSLWNKAKETVLKPTASWTFDILLDYLKSLISNQLPPVI